MRARGTRHVRSGKNYTGITVHLKKTILSNKRTFGR